MFDALMPAGWLQSYSYTIQTLNSVENRNVIRCDIRIFIRILSAYNRRAEK